MKGYARLRIFKDWEWRLYDRAVKLVDVVPDIYGDELIRCHELARAVCQHLKSGKIVDGKHGAVEHTWIMLTCEHVLDVYTPARIPQVQLIDLFAFIPNAYQEETLRQEIQTEQVEKLLELFRVAEAGI